jgi:diguanylate cyclase (GGDEF)-like protein
MDDLPHTMVATEAQQRYKGYDRIMGNISWLLIALVTLAIKLMPQTSFSSLGFLAIFCMMLFVYNVNARYGFFSRNYSQFKIFIDLIVFLAFIVAVCWYTGKLTSPFMSLIYLILMATSLTQGKRVTYFMAGLAISSYLFLAAAHFREYNFYLTHVLELFPFMLIAHLGAMLAGEAESARKEVERLSLTDDVTGINNMRNFFMLADIQEKLAKRYNRRFAICMIDADGLKKINDQYGHFAGTELIRQVAAMVTANIRTSDICARYGGDEFVVMFNETTKDAVVAAVERIVKGMAAAPFPFEGGLLSTTLSAGLAGYPEDGPDVKTVMANADEAMYVSKRTGKNRLTIYAEQMSPQSTASPAEEAAAT